MPRVLHRMLFRSRKTAWACAGPTSSRSCSTVEQPIRADWPEVLFFARASQPLCQMPLIHLAHHGTKCH